MNALTAKQQIIAAGRADAGVDRAVLAARIGTTVEYVADVLRRAGIAAPAAAAATTGKAGPRIPALNTLDDTDDTDDSNDDTDDGPGLAPVTVGRTRYTVTAHPYPGRDAFGGVQHILKGPRGSWWGTAPLEGSFTGSGLLYAYSAGKSMLDRGEVAMFGVDDDGNLYPVTGGSALWREHVNRAAAAGHRAFVPEAETSTATTLLDVPSTPDELAATHAEIRRRLSATSGATAMSTEHGTVNILVRTVQMAGTTTHSARVAGTVTYGGRRYQVEGSPENATVLVESGARRAHRDTAADIRSAVLKAWAGDGEHATARTLLAASTACQQARGAHERAELSARVLAPVPPYLAGTGPRPTSIADRTRPALLALALLEMTPEQRTVADAFVPDWQGRADELAATVNAVLA